MPKRVPTPPPGDDEPKYMTIWFPYPPHPDLDNIDQRRELAYWVARLMRSSDDLFAILYRRKSSSMVQIEINRNYSGVHYLLGAHSWNNFLENPDKDEKGRESRIFWSTYRNGREAGKHGWKTIPIENKWFNPNGPYAKQFRSATARFVEEIPIPSWCDLPNTEVKDRDLCRPIPKDIPKAIEPPERPPPVGSRAWFEKRPAINGKGKKIKAEQKLKARNERIEALYVPPQSVKGISYAAVTGNGKKENTPTLWVAPHPKSGQRGNLLDVDKNKTNATGKEKEAQFQEESQSPSTSPEVPSSWIDDIPPSPNFSPSFESSASDNIISPLSLFPSNIPIALRGSGSRSRSDPDLPDIPNLNLSSTPDNDDDDCDNDGRAEIWGIKANEVVIIENKSTTEAFNAGGMVPSYSWDAEIDPEDQEPICPFHKAACRKQVCVHHEKQLKEWEKMKKMKEEGKAQEEDEAWDSDNDNDFKRIAIKPKGRGFRSWARGRGRGNGRGYNHAIF